MQIHLSPRHLKLTAAIHTYVAEKISHLESISSDILAAHVVLLHDEDKHPERAYRVKAHLAVPGPDVHAEDFDANLYAAIDKATAKLAQQLRKRKTKRKEEKKHKLQRSAERRKRGE